MGTRFHARIITELHADGYPAVIPEVTGTAYRTGRHRFDVDLGVGFVLR